MRVHVGTSGFSYPEWKGAFYPPDLPARAFLGFYSQRFTTVEINNTFYRMPSEKTLLGWAAEVPDSFQFTLKAPQRITHQKRLREADEELEYFLRTGAVLESRRGPTLVQLPPNLKKDLPRLAAFVAALPAGARAAFEFRHESWLADDVYDLLRGRELALVTADTGEGEAPFVPTTDWGYLRLRRVEYRPSDLDLWAERIRGAPWQDVFVYFKHEEEATGPRLAREFRSRFEGS